ncbi:diguanylate cyclase, partial [Lysobacter xanthus]
MTRPSAIALVLPALLALAMSAWAVPSAAGFDRLLAQLDDGDVGVDDEAQSRAALAQLRERLPAGDAGRARLYRSAECALAYRHDSRRAVEVARRGIGESRRARDSAAESRFEVCSGLAYETFDTRAALAAYDRALVAARRAEQRALVGDALVLRGGIFSLQGQQAAALRDFLAAQATYDRAGLARRSEANLLNVGMAYRRMGLYAQALAHLRESEAWARRLGRYPDAYSALMQQGYAHEEHGDGAEAVRVFERALALAAQGDGIDRGYAHLGLAHAWIAAGDAAQARLHVAQARRELALDRTADNEPMLDQADGLALAMQGRHAEALDAFDRAEPLVRRQGNLRYLADLHRARARSEEAIGRPAAALLDLRAFDALATRLREDADDQRVSLWRMRFDADRRALERARLEHARLLREREIRGLERERGWRLFALLLGAVVAGLLAALALQQAREGRRLHRLALTDPLTALANRRAILRRAQDAFREARRHGRPLAVVALDLDHFKRVNDAHGHAAGDAALASAARAFAAVLRPGDRLGRIGGEEFLAVLPDTSAAEAAAIAERLRAALAGMEPAAAGLAVRTSAGVAAIQPVDRRLQD